MVTQTGHSVDHGRTRAKKCPFWKFIPRFCAAVITKVMIGAFRSNQAVDNLWIIRDSAMIRPDASAGHVP
jgi:hypothetical protein